MHDEHDIQLSYREIIRACDSDDNWFTSIIEADIIHVSGDPQQATYNGYQLARIRRAHASAATSRRAPPPPPLSCNSWTNWKTCAKGGKRHP